MSMQGAPIPNCPGGTDPCCDLTFDGTGVTAANPLPVALDGGDIEIGAVEIKDATANTRARVIPGNTAAIADDAIVVSDPNVLAAILAGGGGGGGGSATAALQTTGNASLASIDAGTPAGLGSAVSAASMPVVIASDQAAIPVVGTAADGAAVSGNPVRIGGKDGSGNTQDIATDANGNLSVTLGTLLAGEDVANNIQGVAFKPVASASYAPNVFNNASTATAFSAKASPGGLLSVRATNANAAVRYLQIHNKASAPVAADVALDFIAIPAGTAAIPAALLLDSSFFASMTWCSVGVALAISTTATTYTAATNTDHTITARFI